MTAFIEIDPNNYAARIQDAQKFLATAKDALNKAGFEGSGGPSRRSHFAIHERYEDRRCVVDTTRGLKRPANPEPAASVAALKAGALGKGGSKFRSTSATPADRS